MPFDHRIAARRKAQISYINFVQVKSLAYPGSGIHDVAHNYLKGDYVKL